MVDREQGLELVEGGRDPARQFVVVEFPTLWAREWYGSSEYARALEVRATALRRTLVFVEGVPHAT